MNCYACENPALHRCSRCGNAYCVEHGTNLCASCLDPLNAAPSRSTFRLALMGLLGGSVLALWLLVRPPGVPGEGAPIIRNEPSSTPALTPQGGGGDASATSQPSTTIPAQGTPVATATPGETAAGDPTAAPTEAPTAVPTEAPTEAPAGPIEYLVVDGDTWNGIAGFYGIDGETLAAFNGRTLDDFLQIDEVILIPQ